MRALLSLIFLTALPAAQAGVWTSACMDQKIEYQQITGAEGYLHVQHSDGSYTTVKLKQSFFDGKTICGTIAATVGADEIAAICADNDAQAIRIVKGAELAKGVKPEKAPVYCSAVVNVN